MGGMTRLLLLLWAGVAVSTAVDLQKRIIGGKTCQRPYHVKITDESGNLLCGGSLLRDRWILTAAHCWKWSMWAVLTGQPQPIRITAAPVMCSDNNNNNRVHDIMLLRLPQQVQTPHIELPDCNRRPNIGDPVQVAGYGSTMVCLDLHAYPQLGFFRAPGASDTLHCADFELVDCQTLPHDPQEHPHLICGQNHMVDTSPGDSGGGVEWKDMIYGVMVAGNPVNACASPSGFMDVCTYLPWIQQMTGITTVR